MITNSSLFYFGNDDKDCYLVFKEDGVVKYMRFKRSFLKKVDETYHLKQELRKLKNYRSVADTLPKSKVLNLLRNEMWYRKEDPTESKKQMLHRLIKRIYNDDL